VFAAIRPNARSLSVHQGKGLDVASARASAFMEAAEFDHAERVALPSLTFALDSVPRRAAIADPRLLPRVRAPRRDQPIVWLEGRDLISDRPILVPRALVQVDFTGHPDRTFVESTSGLASGNSMEEAVLSGLFELIERDATALWRLRPRGRKASRRIDLRTAGRGKALSLLARLHDADMAVAVWDLTTDIGIASFACRIRENSRNTRSAFGAFWGAGTHLSREVAFCRAVTEAVQTRLTYISGARDDLLRRDYEEAPGASFRDLMIDMWEEHASSRSYRDVADGATSSIAGDLEKTLGLVKGVGIAHAIAVDLTRAEIGIPVVRVIVPGLEPDEHARGHPLGSRARAVRRKAQAP
jgi:ribosomal protein S12 methylthiotransferase accessory factor